jgi:anti-sigma factor RsiW
MTHLSPEVLLDLALETLPPEEVDVARAHLDGCAECAAALERHGEEQQVLARALGETAAPPALGVKIRGAVAREPVPRPGLRRSMIAAAALLAGLAVWFAATTPDPQPEIRRAMLEQVVDSERLALGLPEGN